MWSAWNQVSLPTEARGLTCMFATFVPWSLMSPSTKLVTRRRQKGKQWNPNNGMPHIPTSSNRMCVCSSSHVQPFWKGRNRVTTFRFHRHDVAAGCWGYCPPSTNPLRGHVTIQKQNYSLFSVAVNHLHSSISHCFAMLPADGTHQTWWWVHIGLQAAGSWRAINPENKLQDLLFVP